MSKGRSLSKAKPSTTGAAPKALLADVRQFVLEARRQTARMVDAGLTLLYWQIGDRIHREILSEKRAGYGERIVSALGRRLESEFGRGFSEKSLRHMIRFAEAFPDIQIVSTLSRQLAWSHFMEIIYLKNDLQRDFYAELCRMERWSVRLLRSRIQSMLYERTALTPTKVSPVVRQSHFSAQHLFKDSDMVEFLNLPDGHVGGNLHDGLVQWQKDSVIRRWEETAGHQFRHSRASGNPGLFL